MAVELSVKDLLEAGVHFGHQTRRWNPKMRPYIYASRDGIHIIDLEQTIAQAKRAYKFVADTVALGGSVLFVGTKRQAQEVIESEAQRAGQFFVNKRWLGGMLTNFGTIRNSIDRLNALCERKEKGDLEKLTKKEGLRIEREIAKLEYNFSGIRSMSRLPSAVFIVDPTHEEIAKKEAIKLKIPVVALTDTNSDPEGIDYIITGNDDAIRSIHCFANLVAEACLEGATRHEAALREQEAKKKEAAAERPKGPAVREQRIGGKGRAWVGRRKEEAPPAEAEVGKYASAKAKPKVEEEETVTEEEGGAEGEEQ
jgi:small subunit ribosomal protein S2